MVLKNKFEKDEPLLTTSVVAKRLGITPDRLRTYDTERLIKTQRVKTGKIEKRLYSMYDVEWLESLRILVKDHKMSISSIKILLQILYKNPSITLPKNEIGDVLHEMTQNPNFKPVVNNF